MSIAEQGQRGVPEPPLDDWGDGPAAYEPGQRPTRPGDRTPPQDNAAEQSVLGAMLLSKDAIADVSETVRGIDFYRPAHEVIHDAIIDLYGRGEPADPVTVAAELQRRGELLRIGGAPYLHTLSANVPIAANAAYYAEIVHEKAILRRLVDAGTKIVQLGYAGQGQVDDVVDQAQAEVYKITDKRTSEDYAPLSDIMDGVLDEIEAIGNREAGLYGVPTGFADLDDLTNGLHAGQMIIVAGRPAMGKALALDTPLATPSGWTTMGEVRVGDLLYDAQGSPTRVVAATEVLLDRPCYEVRFSDGSTIVADAQHQWVTETRAARRQGSGQERRASAAVVTTEQMASSCRINQDQRANHSVVNARPLVGEPMALPIAPYALGAWLGDGHSAGARITCETPEIPMLIESCGYDVSPRGAMLYSIRLAEAERAVNGVCSHCGDRAAGRSLCPSCYRERGSFVALLRNLGVLGDKHIPTSYLRAPEVERRALLAGLHGHRRNGGQGRRLLPVRGDQPASGRRRLRARRQPRLQVRPDQQASARPLRGNLDVLHPQLLHD